MPYRLTIKMGKYIIAGIKTEYEARFPLLQERSKAYEADFPDGEAEIKINISEDFINAKLKVFPYLTREEHEYMWSGEAFYSEILRHGGILLHSSCVEKSGQAYLFSANSGTGKSTHTHLWLNEIPDTRIINDDKPLLLLRDGRFFACGTPFSGKTDENINECVPVRAIVFLHRSAENTLKRMKPAFAVPLFIAQTVNPSIKEYANEMLETTDKILTSVPIFSLGCNKESGTGKFVYEEIEKELSYEN